MKIDDQNKKALMREAGAVSLWLLSDKPEVATAGLTCEGSLNDLCQAWRSEQALREKWRAEYEKLERLLEFGGMRLATSNSARLSKVVDTIVTVPSAKAYAL